MSRAGIVVVLVLLVVGQLVAQEKNNQATAGQPSEAEMQAMMKKMTELAAPGEAHQRLGVLVGVWETETKSWMGGEGSGEPMVTRGTTENSWFLGGRFLKQEFKGEMMGRTMSGFGLTGYDNFAKKYVGMWVDDMSSTLSTMEGSVDRTGKVLTMYGKMDEWMTGELGKTVKYVTRILGKDKHVFEIHDLSLPEPDAKVMEITYTRKK